jgi:hypothetical protein
METKHEGVNTARKTWEGIVKRHAKSYEAWLGFAEFEKHAPLLVS